MMLGPIIADWRFANRLGVRDVAHRIGISPATLSRIENGGNADGRSLIKLMAWLFADNIEQLTKRAKL